MVSCQVFGGGTIPSSYRRGDIAPVASISEISSNGGGDMGNLPAANPVSPGFKEIHFVFFLFLPCLTVRVGSGNPFSSLHH